MASHNYYCAACGSRAKKEPCKSTTEAQSTLGTWHCSGVCRGRVKVKKEKAG